MKKSIFLKSLSVVVIMLLLMLNTPHIIAAVGGGGATDSQCTHGGPGATQCSGSWSIAGASVSCSVTCKSPSYACCYLGFDLEAHCVCKEPSKKVNDKLQSEVN